MFIKYAIGFHGMGSHSLKSYYDLRKLKLTFEDIFRVSYVTTHLNAGKTEVTTFNFFIACVVVLVEMSCDLYKKAEKSLPYIVTLCSPSP